MSIFFDILKCLLCCEEEHYERERTTINLPTFNTFSRSSTSTPNYYQLIRGSDLDTIVRARDVNRTNSSNINSTRTPPPNAPQRQTPAATYVPPRVLNPPYIPPRVLNPPYIPPRVPSPPRVQPFVDIDSASSVKAESLNLSAFSSYPPPSSSSSKSSSKPPAKPPATPPASSSLPKQPPLSSKSSASSCGQPSSSLKQSSPLCKPTLVPAFSSLKNQQGNAIYSWVENTSRIYEIPKDMEDLIKKDIVPGVLKKSLSPSTYKDYFAALLYAEDFYIEKWNDYLLKSVTLELHKASMYGRKDRNALKNDSEDKIFVAFEVDSVPERRPFLLSRDFVFLQPLGRKVEPFQGVIYRVVKSNIVLAEFDDDFHSWHYPDCKYNVSFSFNRFCLKRAHQAVEAATDPSFQNFLFPASVHRNLSSSTSFSFNTELDYKQTSAIIRISGLNRPPPYLIEGPMSVQYGVISKTGLFVREAVIHIFRTSPNCRILICAPTNNTCDVLMRSLKKEILQSDMFRANAAFREVDGVPVDILPSCRYRDECFTCPSLQELRKFKVVLSTFVSSFRLRGEGITAGHFSHIFLVDTSSVTEPEMMVALANLVTDNTAVIATGAPKNRSSWVRSDIARQNGLRISYFERLRESKPYKCLDPMFITQLEGTK